MSTKSSRPGSNKSNRSRSGPNTGRELSAKSQTQSSQTNRVLSNKTPDIQTHEAKTSPEPVDAAGSGTSKTQSESKSVDIQTESESQSPPGPHPVTTQKNVSSEYLFLAGDNLFKPITLDHGYCRVIMQ